MQWFKFYGQDYLNDTKILALNSGRRSCWMTLLCWASLDNGKVRYIDETTLILHSGISFESDEYDRVTGVLQILENLDMIKISGGIIYIKNWEKRQQSSATGAERAKKYRENKARISRNPSNNKRDETRDETRDASVTKVTLELESEIELDIKESKEKNTLAQSYLMNIPEEDQIEITKAYALTDKQLRAKGRELALRIAAKGQSYKDERAFLAMVIAKDFAPRTEQDREISERLKATEIGLLRNPMGVGATETEKWDTGSTQTNIDDPRAKYEGKKESQTTGDMKSLKNILKTPGVLTS